MAGNPLLGARCLADAVVVSVVEGKSLETCYCDCGVACPQFPRSRFDEVASWPRYSYTRGI